ncbi:MAG: nitroreductase family protein [Muribaculaceae bacterium]|nr:nitroreductase family protein [Muribaculaceae bacterium]
MIDNYFKNRFTVRLFSDKEVCQDLIDEIVEAAMHAPTCGNMQLYTVIETRDKVMKTKLEALHFNQPAAATAPVILTVCADFNRFSRWCELEGAVPGYSNFHSFIVAMTDAVIFAQQICTLAEMEGLGTCYLGTVNYNAKEISELLELPELVVPVASIAIGYPKGGSEIVERLPVKAILHREKYRKDSADEIKNLFRVKDEFPQNQEFVKLNNMPSLAHLFTEIRYPKKMNEEVSKSFEELIKEKFMK